MSKNMKSVLELSKQGWTPDDVTWETIKIGSLQRIAIALEGIESQLRYSNNRAICNEKRLKNLQARNKTLRLKLKEKV